MGSEEKRKICLGLMKLRSKQMDAYLERVAKLDEKIEKAIDEYDQALQQEMAEEIHSALGKNLSKAFDTLHA